MAAAAPRVLDQWLPGRGERLVFLIGAPRSGTTWLQLLLAQSPAIATVNETHLFSSYLRSCFVAWRDFKTNARPIGLHRVIDEAALVAGLKHLTDEIFQAVAATRPGTVWVLEKTPEHAFRGREILRLYPEASFIHLIRDPRCRRLGGRLHDLLGPGLGEPGSVRGRRALAADRARGARPPEAH